MSLEVEVGDEAGDVIIDGRGQGRRKGPQNAQQGRRLLHP